MPAASSLHFVLPWSFRARSPTGSADGSQKAAPPPNCVTLQRQSRWTPGETLVAADLKQTGWQGAPLQGTFTRTEDVVGRTLLYPVAGGEPILDRQISAVGAGTGLSTRIPPGMRALSLKSDEVVGVAGYLLPGTHVDVLVTFHPENSQDPMTSTVLQDVQILTAGQKMQP